MNKKQKLLLLVIQSLIIGAFIFMAMASGESSHMSNSAGYSPTYSGSSSSSSRSHTSSNPLLNTLCQKKGMAYQKSANARNASQCEQYCNTHRYGNSCWDQGTQSCWCR